MMNLLHKRMAHYDLPQRIKAQGVYPYFRSIESGQDTEVVMDGRRILMFGSNSYLGLTNHPRILHLERNFFCLFRLDDFCYSVL